MITIYGIPNCDTIKRTRAWFEAAGIDYRFHDYRKDGVTRDLLEGFVGDLGVEAILNRRGTTWRALPDDMKANLDDAGAIDIMLANPAVIKRPVIEIKTGELKTGKSVQRFVGFTADVQRKLEAALA